MGGTERSQILRRVVEGTECPPIFSEGDGRYGTLAWTCGRCDASTWVRVSRVSESIESSDRVSRVSGRVVAWTSGRCDASACGRVSRVSESMESSDRVAEWYHRLLDPVKLRRVVE